MYAHQFSVEVGTQYIEPSPGRPFTLGVFCRRWSKSGTCCTNQSHWAEADAVSPAAAARERVRMWVSLGLPETHAKRRRSAAGECRRDLQRPSGAPGREPVQETGKI